MRVILVISILNGLTYTASAQTAAVYVAPNTTVYQGAKKRWSIYGDLVLDGSLTMEVGADLLFFGRNWNNSAQSVIIEHAQPNSDSNKTAVIAFKQPNPFSGETSSQWLNGGRTIHGTGPALPSLSLDNPKGLNLTRAGCWISNQLEFVNGKIWLHEYDLRIGTNTDPGKIKGYNQNSYIIADNGSNSGSLTRRVIPGDTTSYPIGTRRDKYTPAAIRNQADQPAWISMGAKDGVWQEGDSGISLDEYTTGTTWRLLGEDEDLNLDLFLQHDLNDEGVTFQKHRASSYISRMTPHGWDSGFVGIPAEPGWITSATPIVNAGVNHRSFRLNERGGLLLSKQVMIPISDCHVDFTYFNIQLDPFWGVKLNWGVDLEDEVLAFKIERRISGSEQWTKLAEVPTQSKRHYSWVDQSEAASLPLYYRIELICLNGESKYSEQRLWISQREARVFPNPNEGVFTLYVVDPEKVIASVLFDAGGRMIMRNSVEQMLTQFDIRNLATGAYFLSVWYEHEEVPMVFKIVKLN